MLGAEGEGVGGVYREVSELFQCGNGSVLEN